MANNKLIRCKCGKESLFLSQENGILTLEIIEWQEPSWWRKLWREYKGRAVILEKESVADLVDYLIEVQNSN